MNDMRFPFLIVVLLFVAETALGQQLGRTKEEVVAQNGAAIEENHNRNTAVYRTGPWKFDILYADNIAKKLTVTKIDTLTDDEIRSVLESNADGGVWHEIELGGGTRMWQRSDLATAQCDRIKPRSISMTAAPTRHASTIAVPARIPGPKMEGATAVSSSTVEREGSRRSSSPKRPLPMTPKSEHSPPGNPSKGLGVFLFSVCTVIGLLKGVVWMLPTRRKRNFVNSSRKAAPSPVNPPPLPKQSSPALALTLDDISWENFELLAGEIFRRKGFEVEICAGLGADGGIDLTLRRDGEVRLVQCKCWGAGRKIPVTDVREFYGLIVAEKAKSGIFMTTGLYSRDAREFAEEKPIELLGRGEIEQLMASVEQPGENLCIIRNWIDQFAATAHVTDPNCPRCRLPMKLRRGATGRAFWGCCQFPRCWAKREARTELVRVHS